MNDFVVVKGGIFRQFYAKISLIAFIPLITDFIIWKKHYINSNNL